MNDIIEKLDKAMDDMIDLERDAMNVNNIKDKNYYRGAFNGLCFAKHLLMDTETNYCKQIDVDDFEEKEAGKIKFCPVCGRKLEEIRNREEK